MPRDHLATRPLAFELGLMQELPALRTRALLLEKNRTSAEDLLQDVVERALRNWSRFRPGSSQRRWLFTIMRNLFVDRCRDRSRYPAKDLPDVADPSWEEEDGSPSWEMVSVSQAQTLAGRLEPWLHETVQLVLFERRSYREAAAQLGVAIPTIGTRIGRARAKLRAFLVSSDESTTLARAV